MQNLFSSCPDGQFDTHTIIFYLTLLYMRGGAIIAIQLQCLPLLHLFLHLCFVLCLSLCKVNKVLASSANCRNLSLLLAKRKHWVDAVTGVCTHVIFNDTTVTGLTVLNCKLSSSDEVIVIKLSLSSSSSYISV